MNVPHVELRALRKEYGAVLAVDSVSLSIQSGEFVVLLGPSGSGKTTLLSMIGGFVTPTAGDIFIDGEEITHFTPARRPTATVFQDYALFPHMSVAGNVNFGLAMHKMPKPERQRRVRQVLEIVGLAQMENRRVHELSGGQRQRVALARAIAIQPTVLLLDEPLGALDLKIRRQMQEELIRIQHELRTTFIHVTHDQDEAMSIGDIIVVINFGRVEDVGPPQRVYRRPATRFVANFMGESNVVAGRVRSAGTDEVIIDTALGQLIAEGQAPEGAEVHVSIRPECLRLGKPTDGTLDLGTVHIEASVFQGSRFRLRGRSGATDENTVLIEAPADASVTPGKEIRLHIRKEDIVLLAD